MRCRFCGAPQGAAHDRSIEHGDPYQRVFNGDVAQCGCRWARDVVTVLPDGSTASFGDVLHLCPIHDAATRAEIARDKSAGQRIKRSP